MPVPKRKTSKSRRDKRSSTKGIKPKAVASCQTCQEPVAPHQACFGCGYYKGVKILRTKTDRMYDRGKEREAREVKERAHQAVAEDEGQEISSEK